MQVRKNQIRRSHMKKKILPVLFLAALFGSQALASYQSWAGGVPGH